MEQSLLDIKGGYVASHYSEYRADVNRRKEDNEPFPFGVEGRHYRSKTTTSVMSNDLEPLELKNA